MSKKGDATEEVEFGIVPPPGSPYEVAIALRNQYERIRALSFDGKAWREASTTDEEPPVLTPYEVKKRLYIALAYSAFKEVDESGEEKPHRWNPTRNRIADVMEALSVLSERAAEKPPKLVRLNDFLERKVNSSSFVIEGLLPRGGNVLFAAQAKAGKTTVIGNVIRSLVDGDPLFDHFPVHESRRIALLDFELSPSLLQSWLAEQGIQRTKRVSVLSLRGSARSFDILDDRTRAMWVERLVGFDMLVIDPVRPLLDGLGLNEWHEAGPLLQAIDALKREAGISEAIVVQHHGHGAERAAGDSRFLGWPDTVWNITRESNTDPRSFRFFSAYGRDVDVPRGLLSLYDERRLAFAVDAGEGAIRRKVDELVGWLRVNQGATASAIDDAGLPGINRNTRARIVKAAIEAGLVTTETVGKAIHHTAVEEGVTPLARPRS